MEIKRPDVTYCLNPRRIIYIEYFLADARELTYDNGYGGTFSPDITQSKLDEIKKEGHLSLGRYIRINMTDNKKLTFKINNDSEYNEIKEKLERIIGG